MCQYLVIVGAVIYVHTKEHRYLKGDFDMPGTRERYNQYWRIVNAAKRNLNARSKMTDELNIIITTLSQSLKEVKDKKTNKIIGYDLQLTPDKQKQIAYDAFKYIMDHDNYLVHDVEHESRVMTAYAILCATDAKLAEKVKNQINEDPLNQYGLRLYNHLGKSMFDAEKKNVLEDGQKQIDKFKIKPLENKDRVPLDEADYAKVENLRALYKFFNKEGDFILHHNGADFVAMRDSVKRLLDYVDSGKDITDRAIFNEGLKDVEKFATKYIDEKKAAPKTPLGKARLAAAFALVKNADPKKAEELITANNKAVKSEHGLMERTMKEMFDGVKNTAKDRIDIKPLIKTAKEAEKVPNAEAVAIINNQLSLLQGEINQAYGFEKIKMLAQYVVKDGIKNQLMKGADPSILDNPKIDENAEKLLNDTQFTRLTLGKYFEVGDVDMKEFCKTLPEEMANAKALDVYAAEKEALKNKEPAKDNKTKEEIKNVGTLGIN